MPSQSSKDECALDMKKMKIKFRNGECALGMGQRSNENEA